MKKSLLNRITRTVGLHPIRALLRPSKPPVALPDDFDWKFYLDFYPDLRAAGLTSEADAAGHYVWHGFFEKRFMRPQDRDLMAAHEETRRRQIENLSCFDERQYRRIVNDRARRSVRVSVVITLYNYQDYIDACLRSVLASTLQDIEIVVVNDASTDGSLERCMPFLAAEVPVTVLDKSTNTGLAHCRNLGIHQARGDYVFILDADNEIYARCLEEHLGCMRSAPELIACYGVIDIFDEHGVFCGQLSHSPLDYGRLLAGNYIDAMALFDRDELIRVGMYDEALLERGTGYEDYELWLRIAKRGMAVGFIDMPLSRYVQKNDSMGSIVTAYYHIPLVSFLRRTYGTHVGGDRTRTVVLVAGMHRSGTSALAGLLALMGADPGADLIGPDRSNARGHFEPRKIVAVNDGLLESLGARAPGSGGLPADWRQRDETNRAREKLKTIIMADFSRRDIFMIKDPRLFLLLPLYCDLFDDLGIAVKVVVIRRDQREVVRSLHERDGMPSDVASAYCEKHVRALRKNLEGLEHLAVTFDDLIDDPNAVAAQIRQVVPGLAEGGRCDSDMHIAQFVDPGLRHHRLGSDRARAPEPGRVSPLRGWFTGSFGGPDFMIIGAQRAGTTTLYEYLCLHPQILPAARKELHWFHAGPEQGDSYHTGHRDRRWYERQFPKTGGMLSGLMHRRRVLTFEATPEYLFHPVVPANVFRLYPCAKLIVLLRDPVERAVSQYYHEQRHGFIERDLSMEQYFARDRLIFREEEPKLLQDPNYYSHAFEHCCPVARGDYGRQIARWLRCFPRKQMFIVRSEDMFADPDAVLDSVCAFLGIEPFPAGCAQHPVAANTGSRPLLGSAQREKLAGYFPFDLSVEKFLVPPQYC